MAIFNSYVKLPEGSVCGLLMPLLCYQVSKQVHGAHGVFDT